MTKLSVDDLELFSNSNISTKARIPTEHVCAMDSNPLSIHHPQFGHPLGAPGMNISVWAVSWFHREKKKMAATSHSCVNLAMLEHLN